MRSVLMATLIVGAVVIGGCAHNAKDIDGSKVDPACAQKCSISYSRCTSEMNMKSSPLMSKCGDAYDTCIGTCPAK
jgi:hypothetical protein